MKSMIACLLACLPMFIGCKDDGPVAPNSGSTPPAAVTSIIGAAGGTLAVKGFLLTVPPAAFASTETLKVTPETYDNTFGSRALSGLYKLEGLPVSFSRPLEVRLECSRTPTAGLCLAVGRRVTGVTSGEPQTLYLPIPGVRDSTFLKATIRPDSLGSAPASLRMSTRSEDLISKVKWLLAIDEQVTLTSPSGHFRIHYPQYLQTAAQNLGAILENAYAGFPQMGFDSRTYELLKWPMEVVVIRYQVVPPSPPGKMVRVSGSETAVPWLGMAFEETAIVTADLPTLQRTAARAFCDLFASVNDRFFWPARDQQMMQVERNRIWPYYAVAAWAAEFFAPVGTGGDVPLNFRLQQMCPLGGLTAASGETPEAHGLGLSPLIKYIADTYSPQTVVRLYYGIAEAPYAIDALATVMPVQEREWYPEFLKGYLEGKLFSVASDDLLKDLPAAGRVFTVQGPTDTLKKFTDSYADLSARLYRVNLRYAGLDTSALIRFSIGPASLSSQYVGVMLFGLKNKTLTYWQYGNSVTVKQLKALTAEGFDIVAAVINCLNASPYYGSRTVDLSVSVESGAGKPMSASFRVKLKGTETSGPTPFTGPATMSYSSGFKKGTMAGGIFTASWNESSPDYPSGTIMVTGELMIQLEGSAPPARVIRFYAKETILHSAYNNEVWEVASSGSCDVPAWWEYNRYVHRVTGATVHNMVTTVVNRYDSFGDKYWRSFSNPSGDAQDLIEIVIQ